MMTELSVLAELSLQILMKSWHYQLLL